MKNLKVGSRYAKALIDIALEHGFLDQARKDMETLLEVYQAHKEFRLLLSNPVINSEKKVAILTAIFGASVHPGVLTFLQILTRKRREVQMGTIASEFIRLYKVHKNIRTAYLRTPVPADDNTKSSIVRMVHEKFSCDVEIKESVEPGLIGGFVLKVDDYQLDASILSGLNQLRKQFQENVYKKGF